jgi:hypothetical protein
MNEKGREDQPSGRRARRTSRKARDAALFEHMLEAELAPADLARAMGLSLVELADWVLQPGVIRTLQGLARLADVRAQMLLSKFRANAAVNLIQIASAPAAGDGHDRAPSELSRKACVDLLTTNLPVFNSIGEESGSADEPSNSEKAGTTALRNEQVVLRALEEFAKQEPGGCT